MFCQRLFYFFQKNSIHDICMESHVIALPGCYLISTAYIEPCTGEDVYSVNALSGCYLISTTKRPGYSHLIKRRGVNALSGCYLISTNGSIFPSGNLYRSVNALSGCYLISTQKGIYVKIFRINLCQCPLGLLPHFYQRQHFSQW